MRKITALFINEGLKISQKISVLVMVGIMIFGVVGFCGFVKKQEKTMFGYESGTIDDSNMFTEMQTMVSMFQEQAKSLEAQIKSASEMEKIALAEQLAEMQDRIAMYQLAIDKKIPMMSGNDYRAQALNNVVALKSALRSLLNIKESDRTAENKKAISQYTALISRYQSLVDKQDFREYLNIKNDEIKSGTGSTDAEKQIMIESNDLWYKIDPTGGVSGDERFSNISMALNQITTLKISLMNNLDNDNNDTRPLTADRRTEVENKLAVQVYRLENGLSTNEYNLLPQEIAVQGMFGFGIFMIVLLMMILAGGSVSQEISTGSIKSLIISPTRRWKIFTAKALTLVVVGLAATGLLYVVAMLANGAFFGFTSGAPYVFTVHGTAMEMNFYVFKLLRVLVSFIDVLVYMTLAFMLSIITRNTAASVGISVAVYFGGSIANSFLAAFAKGEWLKFIPFNNLGLTAKFFPFDTLSQMTGGLFGGSTTSGAKPSLLFSLVYLAVLMVCMGYTALDSFNRRDIK